MAGTGTRSGTRSERGAVAMLVAILLGAGVITGVLVIGIDAGRLFFAEQALERDTRGIIQGLTADCLNGGCTSATTLLSKAQTVAAQEASVDVVAVCVDNGTETTTSAEACAPTAAAVDATSICEPLPFARFGTTPYLRLVTQAREAFRSLFAAGMAPRQLQDCDQATWNDGYYRVPRVVMMPACSFGAPGVDHLIAESTSNSTDPKTGGCGTIDFGNGWTITSGKDWLAEVAGVLTDSSCVGTDLLNLQSPPELVGNRIVKNGYCSPTEIQRFFTPPTGTNPRIFALASTLTPDNYATIEAFARFTLVAMFDGLANRWEYPDGSVYPGDTKNFDPSGRCSGTSGKLCFWGHFDPAIAVGHGSTPERFVRLLP